MLEISLYWIFLAVIVVIFIIAAKVFLNKKKSNVLLAEIDKIETLFIKNHKFYEPYLAIKYRYTVKKKEYEGYCKIPFSLLTDINNNVELYYNYDLNMPILQINQEYYVGNEVIEHKLMSIIPYIPIRYLTSDPSRNFILPLNRKYGFFNKKIKKIS
jgi:hypothetical protein